MDHAHGGPAARAGRQPVRGRADECQEGHVVQGPPRSLPDPATDIEARDDDGHQVERDLSSRDREWRIWRKPGHRDLRQAERHRLVEGQEHAVDGGQPKTDRREILVQAERDRSMGDRIEDLGREQEPVDDGSRRPRSTRGTRRAVRPAREGWPGSRPRHRPRRARRSGAVAPRTMPTAMANRPQRTIWVRGSMPRNFMPATARWPAS